MSFRAECTSVPFDHDIQAVVSKGKATQPLKLVKACHEQTFDGDTCIFF